MKNKKNGMPEMTGAKPMKRKADMKLLGRVFRMLVQAYPVLVPITGVCIVLSAIVSSIPSIFMQKVFDKIADSIAIIKKPPRHRDFHCVNLRRETEHFSPRDGQRQKRKYCLSSAF